MYRYALLLLPFGLTAVRIHRTFNNVIQLLTLEPKTSIGSWLLYTLRYYPLLVGTVYLYHHTRQDYSIALLGTSTIAST